MEYTEIRNFINSIQEHSDDEILDNYKHILWYLHKVNSYQLESKFKILATKTIRNIDKKVSLIREFFYDCLHKENVCNVCKWNAIISVLENSSQEERVLILKKLFHNVNKENEILDLLDIPIELKYGIELEYNKPSLEDIKKLFENGMIKQIFESLDIPANVMNSIVENSEFEVKNHFDKWVFSKETDDYLPEVSSPILTNNLDDLNKIRAIVLLFNALGSNTHGGTGLHVNIGVDYFKGKIKAIEILLKIYSECEELFFKIANETGEVIRSCAFYLAGPIKANIEKTFEEQENLCLETEEDFWRFIYNIQVRNRLDTILIHEDALLEFQLSKAKNEEERYAVFKKYVKTGKDKEALRYTSINFSHVNWPKNEGRIEFRLFNSTSSLKVVLLAILLIGKLCEVSLKICENPEYKQNEYNSLFNRNVSEKEKLKLLLNLLLDNDEVKLLFMERWESVKDKKYCYEGFKVGAKTFLSNDDVMKYSLNNK